MFDVSTGVNLGKIACIYLSESLYRTLTSNLLEGRIHFLEATCRVPAVNPQNLAGGTKNTKIQSTRNRVPAGSGPVKPMSSGMI